MNTWSLVGGGVWTSCGTFRRRSLAGGGMSLGVGFEYCCVTKLPWGDAAHTSIHPR